MKLNTSRFIIFAVYYLHVSLFFFVVESLLAIFTRWERKSIDNKWKLWNWIRCDEVSYTVYYTHAYKNKCMKLMMNIREWEANKKNESITHAVEVFILCWNELAYSLIEYSQYHFFDLCGDVAWPLSTGSGKYNVCILNQNQIDTIQRPTGWELW